MYGTSNLLDFCFSNTRKQDELLLFIKANFCLKRFNQIKRRKNRKLQKGQIQKKQRLLWISAYSSTESAAGLSKVSKQSKLLMSCTGICIVHIGLQKLQRRAAAYLCRWRTKKARVSLLASGRSLMVWYIRAMLLSSSETSEREQRNQFHQQGPTNKRLCELNEQLERKYTASVTDKYWEKANYLNSFCFHKESQLRTNCKNKVEDALMKLAFNGSVGYISAVLLTSWYKFKSFERHFSLTMLSIFRTA